jgi:hypothetical protein
MLGYAMSRLDKSYLSRRNLPSWKAAYEEAASALSEPPASFNNLRDEFDPLHEHTGRKGWRNREMRSNRARVADELQDISDDALLELVARILTRDEESIIEAVDSLAAPPRIAYNVAERLLTGRLAEEYFLEHAQALVQTAAADIVDTRNAACGFDFLLRGQIERAVEVKGMKPLRGDIQFTDREWLEAKHRGDNYLLVVVGNLQAEPLPRVVINPYRAVPAVCSYRQSVAAVWRATVAVST